MVILCPHAGSESEFGVVRHLDCGIDAACAEQHVDGAEEFLVVNRAIPGHARQHSRLIEISGAMQALTAGQRSRARSNGLLDLLVQLIQDFNRGQRSDVCCWVQRISHIEPAHRFDKALFELFVNLFVHDEALGRDTGLAAVHRACLDRCRHRVTQVCARHHNERIAAA